MVGAWLYFLVTGALYSSPLMLLLWLRRDRIGRTNAALILATGFAAATAFSLWRMEWFDVWRHGIGARSLSYVVTSYGPPIVIFAMIGAALGAMIVGGRPARAT
jgi:hypothetical protein